MKSALLKFVSQSVRMNRVATRVDRSHKPIRVMVVDDAVVVRGLIARWIDAEPDMDSGGRVCAPGARRSTSSKRAIPMSSCSTSICRSSTAFRRCRCCCKKKRDLVVIMASTLTRRNAEISLRALSLGAADYVPKPETRRDVDQFGCVPPRIGRENPHLGAPPPRAAPAPARQCTARPTLRPPQRCRLRQHRTFTLRPFSLAAPRALLIGSSTGGPQALVGAARTLIAAIDRAPVLITQHMPPTFTTVLAEHLDARRRTRRARGRGRRSRSSPAASMSRPAAVTCASCAAPVACRIALGDDPPDQFLQAGGRPSVLVGGGSLGAPATSRSSSPAWAPTAPAAPRISSRRAAA